MRLLAALLLTLTGCGCVSVPSHDDLRATTLRLEFPHAICSGTAIGPDRLLTAEHCLTTGPLALLVNGQPVTVVDVSNDKRDHAVLRLSAAIFKHWARFGPPLHQGDRVRWWGNPMGEPDVYREGYVSRAWIDAVVIDATVCHGDSGAGLFNDAGQLVGVVSAMSDQNGCTFELTIPTA